MIQVIPAYREKVEKEYVEKTTTAKKLSEVASELLRYVDRKKPCNQVRDAFVLIVENEKLLKKTQIVTDGSYRNCVLLVRPDEYKFIIWEDNTREFLKGKSLEESLKVLAEKSETFFVNLCDETLAERHKRLSELGYNFGDFKKWEE